MTLAEPAAVRESGGGGGEEEEDEDVKYGKFQRFCLKYFCQGQKLEKGLQDKLDAGEVEWTTKYRKQLAMLIPFAITHLVWWTAMIRWDSFHKFTDSVGKMDKYKHLLHSEVKPWYMSVTMVFGSMVAGATSEGGASVAFPVMTLGMDAKPFVAKQFSYMIQSVGMTAAAFVIIYMQVQVEWKSIWYCSLGGLVGLIYGLEEVAPTLTPPYAKMYFVVIWGSFAASLFYLNRIYGRKVYHVADPKHLPQIWKSADLTPYWVLNLFLNWKVLVLLAAGFIGGIFTSIAGSGIDICSFAVLTLLFRVSEKTATPTSVVLMAINTFVAMVYCKFMMREGLSSLAWEFFCVCAPIVVVGAPLGSVLGSYVHRLVLAAFVYVTDFVQLLGALIVVQPWSHEKCHKRGDSVGHAKNGVPTPNDDRYGSKYNWSGTNCEPLHLCWSSGLIFVCGLVAFWLLQHLGEKLIQRNNKIEAEAATKADAEKDLE
jgi:uncharacterized membrane protein YfcA